MYVHLPNQLFIPIGRVYPSHSNNTTFFFDPINCVNLILEHNLTSGKIPDWKISGVFTNCQLHIDQHTYCLIRGVLSHNFGEYSNPSVDTKVNSKSNYFEFQFCSLFFILAKFNICLVEFKTVLYMH